MLAEEDKNAEDKSLDGAWYKRKQNQLCKNLPGHFIL